MRSGGRKAEDSLDLNVADMVLGLWMINATKSQRPPAVIRKQVAVGAGKGRVKVALLEKLGRLRGGLARIQV